MALDTIYKLHSIEIQKFPNPPLDAGNAFIGALDNITFPVNATVERQVPSGRIFATTGRIDFTTTDLTFSSTMAKVMLDELSVSGRCIDVTGDNINLYVAKYNCDGPAPGSVHLRYTIVKGILYPTTMNCDHKGDLTVGGMMKAVYDGTNDPVAVAPDQSLPGDALFQDRDDRWTLHDGSANKINDVALDKKTAINVDFGITTESYGADSNVFDEFAAISTALPVVTVDGLDPRWFPDLGLTSFGKVVTHANTRFFYRKRDGAGGFIADNIAEHIEVTAYGPANYTNLLNGSGTGPAGTSLQVSAVEDSVGNDPLMIDTTRIV